jgi:hypothetical protein
MFRKRISLIGSIGLSLKGCELYQVAILIAVQQQATMVA